MQAKSECNSVFHLEPMIFYVEISSSDSMNKRSIDIVVIAPKIIFEQHKTVSKIKQKQAEPKVSRQRILRKR